MEKNVAKLPFVSIVIPVKNEGQLLEKCLKSIREMNYPDEKYEIIISDGLSTDNTREVAESFGAKVVTNEKMTVSPGRNVGFEASKGELIAFTDADCVADKNWIRNAIAYFKDNEIACVGGPNLTPKDDAPFGKAVSFIIGHPLFAAGSIHAINLKEKKFVDSIPGCNAIYKREALEKVMPIVDDLLTCDDTQMNRKILDQGYKLLYTPDTFVWHYRRHTPNNLYKQMYRYSIGRLQVGKRDKRMINLIHIAVGFSIPFFLLLSIALFLFDASSFRLLFLCATGALLFIGNDARVAWKSLKVGAWAPLVILIIMTAWSTGFLRELISPMKQVAGK